MMGVRFSIAGPTTPSNDCLGEEDQFTWKHPTSSKANSEKQFPKKMGNVVLEMLSSGVPFGLSAHEKTLPFSGCF